VTSLNRKGNSVCADRPNPARAGSSMGLPPAQQSVAMDCIAQISRCFALDASEGHDLLFPGATGRNEMKRSAALGAIFVATLAAPATAALQEGARAPDFTAQASLGGKEYSFSLADALKKGPVVLYFYPAAFSKGCTIEAHDFAEAMPQYAALGAT